MRARRLGPFPFALLALGTIACTSILGTFEVGDVASTDGGGGTPDGPAPGDAASDTNKPVDGGADSADAKPDVPIDAPAEGGGPKCRVADGGAGVAPTQVFNAGVDLVGCAGSVAWADRALLCGAGCTVASADKFVAYNVNDLVPTHSYWTDDDLRYSGQPPACAANNDGTGSPCTGRPMRVCPDGPNGSNVVDPLGNTCTWTGCGLNKPTTNNHFGGCASNPTAGTLCFCQ